MLSDGDKHIPNKNSYLNEFKTKIIRPTLSVNPRRCSYVPQIPKGLVIIRDTREQLPYSFNNKIPYIDKALKFGDYSIKGYESKISIERKSASDFYGTIAQGRERFNRMLCRMNKAEFKGLVIECSEEELLTPELSYSNIHPNSVYGSIISFEIKHGVHIYYGDRKACQIKIINLFVKFWKLKKEEDKKK